MSENSMHAETSSVPTKRVTWTWQGFLAGTSALVGVAAVLLHLIGNAVHQSYLDKWGVDAGQFPKSTDWLVIQGYYGLWNALGVALLSLMSNVLWVIVAGTLLALYVAALKSKWNPLENWESEVPRWVARWPESVRKGLLLALMGGLISIVLIPVMFSLFVFAGLPALVGKGIGEELAVRQARDFSRGCAASKSACIRLLKGDVLVSEGYLIDSSDSHIALLDSTLKKARVIERAGLELQATRYP